jgi:hypothetical protein
MSDIQRRTVFYYRDKVKTYDATDGINKTVEYIKFMPWCKVNVNGQNYLEPWSGTISANWKASDVGFDNFDATTSCNMITDMVEVDPDKFSILMSEDANNTVLVAGTLNTRVGK